MQEFNKKLQEQLNKMSTTGKLFRSAISGQQLWDIYLASFEDGDDPVFRDPNSSTHNCNICNNFIRRYGNIVTIVDDKIVSLFDFEIEGEFKSVALELSRVIRDSFVKDVFFETFNELKSLPYESCSKSSEVFKLGIDKNVKRYTKEEAELYGVVKANEIRTFNHMHVFLPAMFVDMSGKSIESIMGDYRSSKEVFKRAMDEISLDTLRLVRDLINQGSLLDGQTHLHKVETMIPLKEAYDKLSADSRDNWCWVNSYKFNLAKFKNELIGVLCSELSEGEEINKACQSWNKRVDPANYMKAVAPITANQIKEAKKFVEENGYEASFDRRLATIDDIKVSEILHVNSGKGEIKSVSIFDGVKSTSTRHKRNEFDGVEEVDIEKFMKDILPTCTSVEVFLKNTYENNLVTLTTANNKESKPIFKWDNNYSWTYNGNLAGKSQIKEAVATKGGKVDGVLRFSIMWAEGDPSDNSDLDAHCKHPNGHEIYYADKVDWNSGGKLDVDIVRPAEYNNKNIVENITFPTLSKMKNGVYKFSVNPFSVRGSKGFKAEIEFNGEIYSYSFDQPVGRPITVAEVTLKNGQFTIEHKLPETGVSSREIYGLNTNEFHKVNLVCLSPNHWGNNSTGNKHYFFMLEGCKSINSIRGFHNENLLPDLAQHRKVLEVLGTTNMIESTNKQLSGVGFNATVFDKVTLRLTGSFKRIINVKFGNG